MGNIKKIKDYSKVIMQETSYLSGPLAGELSYIKSQDTTDLVEKYICTNFFGKDISKVTQKEIDNILTKIDISKSNLINLKSKIKEDNEISITHKNLLLNEIDGILIKISILKKGVYIEAHKGGYPLSKDLHDKYLRQIDIMQNIVYGPEILTLDDERSEIVNYMNNLFKQNKGVLNQGQIDYFESIFLKDFAGDIDDKEINAKVKNISKDKTVSRKVMIQVFSKVFEIYGLNDWKVVEDDTKSAITVEWKKCQISFPTKFNKYKISRICELIDHEISVHAIRGQNTQSTIGISMGEYLEEEEGNAVFAEKMVSNNIENIKIEPTIHHITTMIAEKYPQEQCLELFRIYYLLSGKNAETADKLAKNRIDRTKRFHNRNLPGANRKDVSYTRGMKSVVEFYNNSSSNEFQEYIKKFYIAKIGTKDSELLAELQNEIGQDISLINPLWIGKILFEKFNNGKGVLNNLSKSDKRFEKLDKLSFSTKKKLIEILDLFRLS